VYITGSPEITNASPANIYAGIGFDCVRISVLQRSNSRSGDLSVERNCLWSAESSRLALAIVVLGVLLRIAVVALPGNQLRAPWSGGGDAPRYVLLAENLLSGKGLRTRCTHGASRPGYPAL